MRTYLVTGGAGFIGSNYIHYMFKKYGDEIRIINVDVLTYAGNLENLKDVEDKPNYTFIRADICDKEAISKILIVWFILPQRAMWTEVLRTRKCLCRPMCWEQPLC